MHYGTTGWTGQGLEATHPEDEELIGNRAYLTKGDIAQVNDMYQCKRKVMPREAPADADLELVWSCSFEHRKRDDGTYCGTWADAEGDQLDWTSTSGGTPSSNTGPERA